MIFQVVYLISLCKHIICRCIGFGDVAAVMIFLFDVSMRWIGLRLDLMAGMMTVGTTLVLVLTKGYIPPASGGLVLGLCGKVGNETHCNKASIADIRPSRKQVRVTTTPSHPTFI